MPQHFTQAMFYNARKELPALTGNGGRAEVILPSSRVFELSCSIAGCGSQPKCTVKANAELVPGAGSAEETVAIKPGRYVTI